MSYAWIITKDHLENLAVGVLGPREASVEHVDALRAGAGTGFRMYDDDGILYYSGRGIWDEESEDAHVGPLRDFGRPSAGAVRIEWDGDPSATCEW